MASTVSEDENSLDDFSDDSQFSLAWDDKICEKSYSNNERFVNYTKSANVAQNFLNRQVNRLCLTSQLPSELRKIFNIFRYTAGLLKILNQRLKEYSTVSIQSAHSP